MLELEAYVELGATLTDAEDGYLGRASVAITDPFGSAAEAVTTHVPTAEGKYWSVAYSGEDKTGNEAVEVVRRVAVKARCASPSYWCVNRDACATCTDSGVCLCLEMFASSPDIPISSTNDGRDVFVSFNPSHQRK